MSADSSHQEVGIVAEFRRSLNPPVASRDTSPGIAERSSDALLPMRLAQACVAVLPVAGASLGLFSAEFRVPLGGSDDLATVAERLQFTQGDGPCLSASKDCRMVVATASDLSARWPAYAEQLAVHTPYRAVVSIPLPLTETVNCALDLYLTDVEQLGQIGLANASQVCDEITLALLQKPFRGQSGAAGDAAEEPGWLHSPTADVRNNLWIAIGLVMTGLGLTAADTLALLRAYSFARDAVLDDVASDLTSGRLQARELAA